MFGGQVIVSANSVFAISNEGGDIHPKTTEGFYAFDTRFLSTLRLTVQGREPEAVGANQFDHSMASFYLTSTGMRDLPAASVSVVRDRYVREGLHEDINLVNHSAQTRTVHLEVTFDADFADVFEVRLGPIRKTGRITLEEREGQHLALVYQSGAFRRETWIAFSAEPVINGKTATFDVTLHPKETWKTCVTISPVAGPPPSSMQCVEVVLGTPFGAYRPRKRVSLDVLSQDEKKLPLEEIPRLETDNDGLRLSYDQAIADLRSLRMEFLRGHHILAAGLPWFMAVFGRDSIISAIQTKLLGLDLMFGTLHTLASLQAVTQDRFRESDPGKILHEVRLGELSVLEHVPHSRYYGSIDATPLFLILLWEAYQWTGEAELLQELLRAAESALRWIDDYGDADKDGFLEYKRKTRHGLRNQGWKDSGDSTSFKDGRLAEGPIALAEVQGYVYAAKRSMAQIYRVQGKTDEARALERAAQQLKEHFNEAFWMPEEGYFALALDGYKRQVDSIASNAGHCLWSGIVDEQKAPQVVERLMAPDMFSGWGIRTLSSDMARYNPVSYHNGSVWPHDNSLIASGMSRYGFNESASTVAWAIIEASAAFPNHRLPELFAGYPRREYSFPVPYPAANAPQAWASGAVIYLMEVLLRVFASGDRLLQEAPQEGPFISLSGVKFRGSRRVL